MVRLMILSIVWSAGATALLIMLVIARPQFSGMYFPAISRLPGFDLRERELSHKKQIFSFRPLAGAMCDAAHIWIR